MEVQLISTLVGGCLAGAVGVLLHRYKEWREDSAAFALERSALQAIRKETSENIETLRQLQALVQRGVRGDDPILLRLSTGAWEKVGLIRLRPATAAALLSSASMVYYRVENINWLLGLQRSYALDLAYHKQVPVRDIGAISTELLSKQTNEVDFRTFISEIDGLLGGAESSDAAQTKAAGATPSQVESSY